MANSTNQMRTSPKSEGRQQIALNMFPLVDQSFQFQVYRCKASEGEEAPAKSVRRYSLPESDTAPDQEGWLKYWVSFEERDGHGAFVADSATNPHLTIAFLFHALIMVSFGASNSTTRLHFKQYHFWLDSIQFDTGTV